MPNNNIEYTADETIIQFDELEVSFFTSAGEVRAVRGISYRLDKGEVLGIVGESGSGKSVSVNALMKILTYPGKVVGGKMFYKDKDIQELSKSEIQNIRGKEISMIFQDPMTSLNPVFTIGDQMTETIKKHLHISQKEAQKKATEMLELVGINNPARRLKQYPHEFSGGMRQRVMIAMSLSCEPEVLIADEPTTALDVTIQAQILDLINNLKNKTNAAIILITHDLGVVSEVCNNIIVMYAGKIVERGTREDIFYNTAHPYTKGLLKCLPRLDSDGTEPLVPIEGTPVDLLNLPKGCTFAARCKECMKICLEKEPPEFEFSDKHTAACWLHTIDKTKFEQKLGSTQKGEN